MRMDKKDGQPAYRRDVDGRTFPFKYEAEAPRADSKEREWTWDEIVEALRRHEARRDAAKRLADIRSRQRTLRERLLDEER